MITLRGLANVVDLSIYAVVAYVTFTLVSWPFRWAMKKWKEMK